MMEFKVGLYILSCIIIRKQLIGIFEILFLLILFETSGRRLISINRSISLGDVYPDDEIPCTVRFLEMSILSPNCIVSDILVSQTWVRTECGP